MNGTETALQFSCHGSMLVGILGLPAQPAQPAARGVLIVVGGPQYRAGSHRQFTLLARGLAAAGVPVMRFDYRGMGDSEGEARRFDEVDDDLRAAIDTFFRATPALESVVIWGLCDGACAALFYAHTDPRVSGLVLLNPWVRTETGAARTQLKHYYTRRLVEREFWLKIVRGRFDYAAAARSLAATIAQLTRPRAQQNAAADGTGNAGDATAISAVVPFPPQPSLPEKMRIDFSRFGGKVLLITSGRDLTAREFLDTVAASDNWRNMLRSSRVERQDLAAADHTFSRREWRDQVAAWTRAWLASW